MDQNERLAAFIQSQGDILKERIFTSNNGRLLVYNVPTFNVQLTLELIFEKCMHVVNTYGPIVRFSVRFGFIIEESVGFNYFYPSCNTSLNDGEFYHVTQSNPQRSLSVFKKDISNFDHINFMNRLYNKLSTNSSQLPTMIANFEVYCVRRINLN